MYITTFFAEEKFYEATMISLILNFLKLFFSWAVGKTRFSMIQIGVGLMSRYIKNSLGGSNFTPEMKERELKDISSTLRLIVGE